MLLERTDSTPAGDVLLALAPGSGVPLHRQIETSLREGGFLPGRQRGEAPAGHDALAAPPGLTGPAAPWGWAGSGIPEAALGGSAASLAPKE